jgi:outer membrane protein assembly factor BamB
MSITVPTSAPEPDEFYYVLLSAWDNAGSYDQIGFADAWGTWGLTYSWTVGDPRDYSSYRFTPNAMALSPGVTYTFYITTQSGVTNFTAYQGATQVWSYNAPTGGDYLILSNTYSGWGGDWYNYQNYEEVWQASYPGGSPDFDFYFYNNYWVSTSGGSNSATWTVYRSGAPSNVAVVIDGNTVLVQNPGYFGSARGSARWPMFHHGLTHTGYSTSTAPNTNQILWSYTTGGYVDSSPAVADGKVYVGSRDNRTYALNATNGAYIWSYTTGWRVESSPAVADGKVYVGSWDSNVYALNATNGAYIWGFTTGNVVSSSPAVADGKVYIGSWDRNVYALNATTGTLIWSYTTGSAMDSSPAVADGMVFIGSYDSNVYALNATNGAYIWRYATGGYVMSSPAVADGMVFIGSQDRNVYALDATTGTLIWSYTTGGIVAWSTAAVADGMVFIGSMDNNVYALNSTTGTLIWSYLTGNTIYSSPAVADGMVFIGSFDSNVYALNSTTGAYIWRYATGGYVMSSPAVAGGVVYVGSADDKVYAFGVHDVAVTNVAPSKTVVGQGFSATINVTVANQGDFTETFNVTAYANTTVISTLMNLTLANGNSSTVTFTWDTTGFAKGNYTISAYAWPVPGETDTADNSFVDGWVVIAIVGDITGSGGYPDGKVDARDVSKMCSLYGVKYSDPKYEPNWDLTGPTPGLADGKIDARDVSLISSRYGQKDP